MANLSEHTPPLWLRVLRFPLVRLILFGPLLFLIASISNGLWGQTLADRPLICTTVGLAMLIMAGRRGNIVRPPWKLTV